MMIHKSLMVLAPINENENDGMASCVMRQVTASKYRQPPHSSLMNQRIIIEDKSVQALICRCWSSQDG